MQDNVAPGMPDTRHKKSAGEDRLISCLQINYDVEIRNERVFRYDIFGIANSAPEATPTGHRLVMVFSLV